MAKWSGEIQQQETENLVKEKQRERATETHNSN